MVELKTIPYLDEFLRFLTRYGDVRFEPITSVDRGEKFRITAGDIECACDISDIEEKLYKSDRDGLTVELSETNIYLGCRVTLPDHNNGDTIYLCAVYKKDGSTRRLDAWGEREDIPFP